MATHTLSILKPSVNNLTVRIFVRAAGLDFEEVDVWGKKSTPDFLAKDPADLTPLLEEEGLPKGSLWESCAIMQYLCNKHGLDRFYPTDPGERAMVDSAMFYLIGTFYPLLARATYPSARFGSTRARLRLPTCRTSSRSRRAGTPRTLSPRRSRPSTRSSSRASRSSAVTSPPSRTCAGRRRSSSSVSIDYDFPAWAEEYLGGWRRPSATRTRSPSRTSAATSTT